ncbi:unnamed protein product [Ectocarpus sp. 12 AP-2014]
MLSVLRGPRLHQLFESWLERHNAGSLLKFWVECDEYNSYAQRSARHTKLQPRALSIYQRYLRPGCAPNKLELDAETCEDIAETLYSWGKAAGGGVTFKLSRKYDGLHTIFHGAMRKTFQTLLFDYLPDFLASQPADFWQGLADIGSNEEGVHDGLGGGEGRGKSGGPPADAGQRGQQPSQMNKVTAKDAFLEHPKIVFHIKRYLASLSSMGARRGGSVDVGDRNMGTRCLDCLEEIRDFQKATTAEQRRKRWAVIRMRYCGEGGISAPTLDALAMSAAADGKYNEDNRNRHNSGSRIQPSSSPSACASEEYQLASMLDKAHDEIVDMLMTEHLAGYQTSIHSQQLEDSWARERKSGRSFRPTTVAATPAAAATTVANHAGHENTAPSHAPKLVLRNAQPKARRRYLGGSGSVNGGASGKREPIRDPTARPANAQTRKRESYKLPETRRYSSSDENSPRRPSFYGSIGSSTFRLISPGVPRRRRTEGDGVNLGGGTVTTVGKPLHRCTTEASGSAWSTRGQETSECGREIFQSRLAVLPPLSKASSFPQAVHDDGAVTPLTAPVVGADPGGADIGSKAHTGGDGYNTGSKEENARHQNQQQQQQKKRRRCKPLEHSHLIEHLLSPDRKGKYSRGLWDASEQVRVATVNWKDDEPHHTGEGKEDGKGGERGQDGWDLVGRKSRDLGTSRGTHLPQSKDAGRRYSFSGPLYTIAKHSREENTQHQQQVKPRSQSCCSGLDNIARSMAAEQEAGPGTLTAPRRANKGVMDLMAPSSPSRIGGSTDVSRSSRSRSTSNALHKCDDDELVDMLTLLEDPLGLSLFRRHSQEFFQEENVSLWTEISDFKTGEYAAPYRGTVLEVGEGDSIVVLRAKRARLTFDTYVSEQAENQVNLSSSLRETARQDIEKLERVAAAPNEVEDETSNALYLLDHCDVFDEIHQEVFRLMEFNLWTPFKISKRYEFFASKYWSHHARRWSNSLEPSPTPDDTLEDHLLSALSGPPGRPPSAIIRREDAIADSSGGAQQEKRQQHQVGDNEGNNYHPKASASSIDSANVGTNSCIGDASRPTLPTTAVPRGGAKGEANSGATTCGNGWSSMHSPSNAMTTDITHNGSDSTSTSNTSNNNNNNNNNNNSHPKYGSDMQRFHGALRRSSEMALSAVAASAADTIIAWSAFARRIERSRGGSLLSKDDHDSTQAAIGCTSGAKCDDGQSNGVVAVGACAGVGAEGDIGNGGGHEASTGLPGGG